MMRASVTVDKATRVIELELEPDGAAWDLYDLTATWRAENKRRIFRPQKARLVMTEEANGESAPVWRVASINIAGPLVLKSGAVSESHASRESMTWTVQGWRADEKLTGAPEWVREIVAQAPVGITSYVWTDAERAEEVQAL